MLKYFKWACNILLVCTDFVLFVIKIPYVDSINIYQVLNNANFTKKYYYLSD